MNKDRNWDRRGGSFLALGAGLCRRGNIPVYRHLDTNRKNERDLRTHAFCVRQSRSFLRRVGSPADTGYYPSGTAPHP